MVPPGSRASLLSRGDQRPSLQSYPLTVHPQAGRQSRDNGAQAWASLMEPVVFLNPLPQSSHRTAGSSTGRFKVEAPSCSPSWVPSGDSTGWDGGRGDPGLSGERPCPALPSPGVPSACPWVRKGRAPASVTHTCKGTPCPARLRLHAVGPRPRSPEFA